MDIFIWMYVLLIAVGLISSASNSKATRNFAWLTGFLILWGIQAVRDVEVGNDLVAYLEYFDHAGDSYWNLEPGFQLYNRFINHNITTDPNAFLAIISFCTLLPISLLFRKYSKSVILSYIIFASFILYHFTFSGIRQGLALGIIAVSYFFLTERRPIWFIATVLLASAVHASAIIFLIAYPLCNNIDMTNKKYAGAFIIGIFAVCSLSFFLPSIISMIFGGEKYLGYIEGDAVPAYNLLILLFLFFLMTFLAKEPSKSLSNYRIMIFMAVFCQSLGLISQEATRIGYYFLLFLPLAIPETISNMAVSKINRQLLTIGIVAFMIFFFFYVNGAGYLKVIPYHFYWERM